MQSQTITLILEDGSELVVGIEEAKKSKFINMVLEDDPNLNEPINIIDQNPNSVRESFKFVGLDLLTPLPEIEKPLKTNDIRKVVPSQFSYFADMPLHDLCFLFKTADYLDIYSLRQICAASVAARMKGKSIQEIREMFDIENDFTPEEEAKIFQENKWAEEAL